MKKVNLLTKILIIILISAISFVGIYVQKQNRMENVVKGYDLGMNLEGARVVTLTISDQKNKIIKDKDGKIIKEQEKEEGKEYIEEEKPVNEKESLTKENYEKTKQIIEKRFKKIGVDEYTIKQDENTGKIIIELPENDETDHIVSNINEVGKFEIVDSKNNEVLINNNDIKLSNVLYNTTEKGTGVYLNIELNKEGTEKLKKVSETYKTVEEKKDESKDKEKKEENKNSQKEIIMKIDNNDMLTTSFPEPIENGVIQLRMGMETRDQKKLNETIKNATTIATVLDTGNLPIQYQTKTNQYVHSDITKDVLLKVLVVGVAIILVGLAYLVYKYKKLGLLSSIFYVGLIAIYLLLIRYTNVVISLEGIVAIALIAILNYVSSIKILEKIKEKETNEDVNIMKESFKEIFLTIIPIIILSVAFCFAKWVPIVSFGMAMFWGIGLIAIYNYIVVKILINNK